MNRVRVLPPAQEEIRAAAGWYEGKRRGLGVDFLARLDAALEVIARRPLASPLWRSDRDYRRQGLKRFPYTIYFRLDAGDVVVLAVAHQRQRPGYWQRR